MKTRASSPAAEKFDQLLRAMIAAFGPSAKVRLAHTLIVIGINPGITRGGIASHLKVNPMSTNTDLRALGDTTRHGEPGLRLVHAEPDPDDIRQLLYTLTARGSAVFKALAASIRASG